MPKYNDDILNYYHDDTHIGSFDQNEKNVGTGLVGAPYCGDVMKLQIKVGKNNNGIEYKHANANRLYNIFFIKSHLFSRSIHAPL